MDRAKLYVETTVPSYLTARRNRDLQLAADQQITHEWWESHRHAYDLFVSAAVLTEAGNGDREFAAKRLMALSGIRILQITEEVATLASLLLSQQIIPSIAAPDAVHLACAAVHGIEFLLTWNCKHIHNPKLEGRIAAACQELGFRCPIICTPAELMKS